MDCQSKQTSISNTKNNNNLNGNFEILMYSEQGKKVNLKLYYIILKLN